MSVFRRLSRLARGKVIEWQRAVNDAASEVEAELEGWGSRIGEDEVPPPSPPRRDDERAETDADPDAPASAPEAPVTPRKRRL